MAARVYNGVRNSKRMRKIGAILTGFAREDIYRQADWDIKVNDFATSSFLLPYNISLEKYHQETEKSRKRRRKHRIAMYWMLFFSLKTALSLYVSPVTEVTSDFYMGSIHVCMGVENYYAGFPFLFVMSMIYAIQRHLLQFEGSHEWTAPFYYLNKNADMRLIRIKLSEQSARRFVHISTAAVVYCAVIRYLLTGFIFAGLTYMFIAMRPKEFLLYNLLWLLLSYPIGFIMIAFAMGGIALYSVICTFIQVKSKELTLRIKSLSRLEDIYTQKAMMMNFMHKEVLNMVADHDDLCNYAREINRVVSLIVFIVWTFITAISTEVIILLLKRKLSYLVILVASDLLIVAFLCLNIFFFFSALVHSRVSRQIQFRFNSININSTLF